MDVDSGQGLIAEQIWDDQHVKALLRFARSPMRLIQVDPWHSWIGQRGGLRSVYRYLEEYPFAMPHRRVVQVVIATPDAVADYYAAALHVSRATFFNHLPDTIAAVAQALNEWGAPPPTPSTSNFPAPALHIAPLASATPWSAVLPAPRSPLVPLGNLSALAKERVTLDPPPPPPPLPLPLPKCQSIAVPPRAREELRSLLRLQSEVQDRVQLLVATLEEALAVPEGWVLRDVDEGFVEVFVEGISACEETSPRSLD